MNLIELIIAAVKTIVIFFMILSFVPLLIWMERKGAAYIQDRRGPNRAQILGIRLGGIIHSVADAIKLFTKEEVTAALAVKSLYYIAPILALFVATVTIAVIPFAEPLHVFGRAFSLQIADLKSGLIYVFAMSSLSVYALMLAGWSAGSKFPLFAALRASSQVVSYELAMGFGALSIFVLSGSLSLPSIISDQGAMPWRWNIIRQPVAFLLFFTALLAETNRLPFDLPEGESEIVAGYHTEYSSMRFAMFFMGEYAHIVVGSAIIAALFLGGWQFPFVSAQSLRYYTPWIFPVAWPALGLLILVFGARLLGRFRRKFSDLRDFEVVFFGTPLVILGLIILVPFPVYWNITLPSWAPAVLTFFLQLAVMIAKIISVAAVFIWIRWTLPRFRYDQLMKLGWKILLPIGMVNVLVTAIVVAYYG